MRDGHLRGAHPRRATQPQKDVLAAYVATGGSVPDAAEVVGIRPSTHADVVMWLAAPAHARFHLHFTPTGSSWLNLVERWFRELTTKPIRRGVFRNLPDLVATIYAYIALNNADPRPFVWTASVETILAKVLRCRAILETAH